MGSKAHKWKNSKVMFCWEEKYWQEFGRILKMRRLKGGKRSENQGRHNQQFYSRLMTKTICKVIEWSELVRLLVSHSAQQIFDENELY